MNKREIKKAERPICGMCMRSLAWEKVKVCKNKEVYGWSLNCSCVDETRLKPDVTTEFGSGDWK